MKILFSLASVSVIAGAMLSPAFSQAQQPTFKVSQSEARVISDTGQVEQIRGEWQKAIHMLGVGGTISDCRLMLQPLYDNQKDETYGAVCKFSGEGKPRDILICDDTLIGNLTIKAWGYAQTERVVLDFTKANCPPGG